MLHKKGRLTNSIYSLSLVFFLYLALLPTISSSFQAKSSFGDVNAEVFSATITPENTPDLNFVTSGGTATKIFTTYDTFSQELTYIATFKKQTLKPDGYSLVLNSTGKNPKGIDGELPIIFFDFRHLKDPRLSAYVYNGKNNAINSIVDSYHTIPGDQPDMIASSMLNDKFVKKFHISETDKTITRGFTIDGKLINNHKVHKDIDSSSWEGLKYGKGVVGIWFHLFHNSTWKYKSDKTIDKIYLSKLGWIDTTKTPTTSENPTCGVNTTNFIVKVDETTEANFVGCDPQGYKGLTYKLFGLVDGMKVTELKGVGEPPKDIKDASKNWYCTTVMVSFTPESQLAGKDLDLSIKFFDNNKADSRCSCGFKIPELKPPVCKPINEVPTLECQGEKTSINFKTPECSTESSGDLQYKWTSSCINSYFTDDTSMDTSLTFDSYSGDLIPSNCQVFLDVTDKHNLSMRVSTNVNVAKCTKDCTGEINGNKVIDRCGICGGDGSSCVDCKGIPGGKNVYDKCGVCGGNGKSCEKKVVDCKGIENGDTKIDQCGVCGGDNSTCLDCKGVPNGNSMLDKCGVCEGDGSSCKECPTEELSPVLLELDSRAEEIFEYNSKFFNLIRKISKNKRQIKRAKKVLAESEQQRIDSWIDINGIPRSVKVCESELLCTRSNLTLKSDSFDASVEGLVANNAKLAKMCNKACRKSGNRRACRNGKCKRGRELVEAAKVAQEQSKQDSLKLPFSSLNCK